MNPADPEENGKGLLLVDLLKLRGPIRRYREDLVGFGLAWLVVGFLILLAIWCAKVGS
jgi:hypothetical protein